MKQAIIKDNKPYCSQCGQLLRPHMDYFLVENINTKQRYYKFTRRCSNGCCDAYNYETISMQETKRIYIENDKNIIKVVNDKQNNNK